MADKAISDLSAATDIQSDDSFVLEQNGTAKRLTGQTLINWLTKAADGHGGIKTIEKQGTSGLKDTYRITMADTATFDFVVTNGKSISNVQQTSVSGLTRTYTITFNDGTSQTFKVTDGRGITSITQTAENGLSRTYTISMNDGTSETFIITDGRSITDIKKTATNLLTDTYTITFNDGSSSTFTVKNGKGIQSFTKMSTDGLVDTYRIEYNDGTSDEFTVANGAKGDKGDNTFTHIKFASQEPTEASHSIGDIPDNWIGFYWGNSSDAPTDWTQYVWFQIKGEKGDTGAAATLTSSSVEYQVSDSGSIIPSGAWSASVPVVAQGKYLWTRTINTFNTGSPVISYSVTRMGLDGSGSVTSVANISPDENGNVPLNASDVGALPSTGGDMIGPINMNGQPINGLNPPTEDSQAANMGFVNQQVRNASPNLLVNPNFAKPINQRKIEYSWIDGLGIDRWFAYNSAAELRDGYIRIPARGRMVQLVDMGEELAGGTYTIALGRYTSTGVAVVSSVISVPDELPATDAEFGYAKTGEMKICLAYSPDDGPYVEINNESTTTGYGAVWVGLFPGDIDPKAIRKNQAVDYDLELLKCQKDYIRIGTESGNSVLGVAVGYNATSAYLGIPGLGMRTKYTARMVTDISTLKYTENTMLSAASATSLAGYNAHNGNAVSFSIGGAFTAGKAYAVWLVNGIIEISTGR